jgi:hypothetical protein
MIYKLDSKSILENNLLKDESGAFSLTEEEFEFFIFYFGFRFYNGMGVKSQTFGTDGVCFISYSKFGSRMICINWNKYPYLTNKYNVEKLQMTFCKRFGLSTHKFPLQSVKDYFDLLSI